MPSRTVLGVVQGGDAVAEARLTVRRKQSREIIASGKVICMLDSAAHV